MGRRQGDLAGLQSTSQETLGEMFWQGLLQLEKGKWFSIEQEKFRLDKRKTFWMLRVKKHWHKFPRGRVGGPFLKTFLAGLDGL